MYKQMGVYVYTSFPYIWLRQKLDRQYFIEINQSYNIYTAMPVCEHLYLHLNAVSESHLYWKDYSSNVNVWKEKIQKMENMGHQQLPAVKAKPVSFC